MTHRIGKYNALVLCIILTLLSTVYPVLGENSILTPAMHHVNLPVERNGNDTGGVIPVDVYVPAGTITGDVLVLPGWNFSRQRWYRETNILKIAEEKGFRLIFPEMKTTLYESQYFSNTSRRWGPMPGGEWIRDVLIPQLRGKYGLFAGNGHNFLLGLSTGGRGVALVHLQNPGLFSAGAALSGDFDQVRMPEDRLMTRLYGPYSEFAERWEKVDNPRHEAEAGKWTMPIYIGHGKKDKVVPFDQSDTFYNVLKKARPDLMIIFNSPPEAGHDFAYWGSELQAVFDFFQKAAGTDRQP